MLPRDPVMLQSVLNTKLRDLYPSLQALCEGEDEAEDELLQRLAAAGLLYDADKNRVE